MFIKINPNLFKQQLEVQGKTFKLVKCIDSFYNHINKLMTDQNIKHNIKSSQKASSYPYCLRVFTIIFRTLLRSHTFGKTKKKNMMLRSWESRWRDCRDAHLPCCEPPPPTSAHILVSGQLSKSLLELQQWQVTKSHLLPAKSTLQRWALAKQLGCNSDRPSRAIVFACPLQKAFPQHPFFWECCSPSILAAPHLQDSIRAHL